MDFMALYCTETVKKLFCNGYVNLHMPQRYSRCPDSCIKKTQKKQKKITVYKLNAWWFANITTLPGYLATAKLNTKTKI